MLLLLSGFLLSRANFESRYLDWHEILVAQTASEMIERNDFLVPHILGRPRLKKPPLSYWLAAAGHRVLGEPGSSHVNEFEARLPSLISGLLLIAVTYGIGFQLTRDSRGGLIAAGLIASCGSFYVYSGSARPEMLYALFCALMVFGLLWALRRAQDGRPTLAAAVLAWGAFGLSLMAKGPQFPLFIVFGVLLTLGIYRSRLPPIKVLYPWMALLVLVLPLAYYAYLASRYDNAPTLWASEMMGANRGSIWIRPLRFYYPSILIVSLAPWMVMFCYAAVDVCRRREPMALLLAVCVLVSVFLVSFSGQLRDHYVLPLLSLCCALMAWSLLRVIDSTADATTRSRSYRLLVWGQFVLVGIVIAGVFGGFIFTLEEPAQKTVIFQVMPWLLAAAGFYVASAMILNRNRALGFSALLGTVLLASAAYPSIGVGKSGYAVSVHRFVTDVDAYLPEGRTLYHDSGKHLRYFYNYYGAIPVETLRLERWKRSGEPGSAPYFITEENRIGSTGLQGEVVVRGRHDDKDGDGDWVIFQPARHD